MEIAPVVITFLGISVSLSLLYYQILLRADLEFNRGRTIRQLRYHPHVSRTFSIFAAGLLLAAVGLLLYGFGTVSEHVFFDTWVLVPEVVGVGGVAYFLRKLVIMID